MSCIFCLMETKIVNLMTKKVPRKRMLIVKSLPFRKSFLFSHTFETKLNQLLRQGSSLPTCNFSKWLLRLCVCGFVGFFCLNTHMDSFCLPLKIRDGSLSQINHVYQPPYISLSVKHMHIKSIFESLQKLFSIRACTFSISGHAILIFKFFT